LLHTWSMADFDAIYEPNFPVCTNKINFNRDGGGPTQIFMYFDLFFVVKGVLTVRIGFNLDFFYTSMAYYSELWKEFLHTQKKNIVLKKVYISRGGQG